MNNQTCKTAGTPKAYQNSAKRYLFAIAPVGADLLLLIAIEMLLCL